MSKRSSGLFGGAKGNPAKTAGATSRAYCNPAGSKDVRIVDEVNVVDKGSHPKVPTKGKPNSVTKIIRNGKNDQKRHCDENGDVYLDIDYSDHGNSQGHPIVPHQHSWIKDDNEELQRKRYEKINK